MKSWSCGKTLCLLVACLLLAACAGSQKQEQKIKSAGDLNAAGYTVGLPQGSAAMHQGEKFFDKAKLKYYSSLADGYTAVEYGKLDAFVFDSHALEYTAANNKKLALLPDYLGDENIVIGAAFGKEALIRQVNEFIAQYKTDGTYQSMYQRWLQGKDKKMPAITPPQQPTQTIIIGTEGLNEPMNYYGQDGTLTGFDVEFAQRLGAWLNAEVKLQAMTFDALLASAASGKIDLLIANLNGTEAVKEQMLVSDSYITSKIAVLVNRERLAETDAGITELSQLQQARIGIMTGSSFDKMTQKLLPEAELSYYNTFPDMGTAVKQGKIDGFIMDEPMARYMLNETEGLKYLEQFISQDGYAFALPKTAKGEKLQKQLNEYLQKIRMDSTLKEIDSIWFGKDESKKIIADYTVFPAPEGVLRLATNSISAPFSYVRNGQAAGYDIDIIVRFCREYGYGLQIHDMDFAAIIPGLVSGAYDLAGSCITVTPERSESVLFTQPDYSGGVVMMVRNSGTRGSPASDSGFWQSMQASFEKNFIRENRWQMIVQGIGTTLFISILAAVFGTALGFGVCMLRRMRNSFLSGLAKAFVMAIQGTPIVVLLMILYYVVLGGSNINAVWVAVIGFGINFAAYVSEMLRTGIDAVDKGQIEAAQAIGFNRVQTFVKVTFPQAVMHILPVYKGEFISLVKMTSVVGYIAIQDLTKMSDIIRSRTYEAFFPLIATAIIYFIMAYLLTLFLNLIEIKIDPKKRKRCVKGVIAYDNDQTS